MVEVQKVLANHDYECDQHTDIGSFADLIEKNAKAKQELKRSGDNVQVERREIGEFLWVSGEQIGDLAGCACVLCPIRKSKGLVEYQVLKGAS